MKDEWGGEAIIMVSTAAVPLFFIAVKTMSNTFIMCSSLINYSIELEPNGDKVQVREQN